MRKTQDFYEQNAKIFIENTFTINMTNLYEPFLALMPKSGKILDIGCGSGRDAIYFKTLGFDVDAFDYSRSLVKLAKIKTGLNIQHKSFYDLNIVDTYNGIWACASLLHCERSRLPEVIKKIINALKNHGICYLSFKYGNQDHVNDTRLFIDMNETQSLKLLDYDNILLFKMWRTEDNRPARKEQWLNILFIKRNIV